eukprot:TRINITY_DN19921_c0_g2_i1.p1 TRINITY_DN19921_c0_g2~~TRINITY_DN19921_c0_g2_i1.p1  ORF type:complete len:1237 (+),score=186.89 TRINITY_DN19921_c0_g2_i1:755-4465(+)
MWGSDDTPDWVNLGLANESPGPAVTHTVFDTSEEILWVADQSGRVSAYQPSNFDPSTDYFTSAWKKTVSFQARQNDAVVQLMAEQWGLISLSCDTLRVHSKGGLANLTFMDSSMAQLLSFAYADSSRSQLCLAGTLPDIYILDFVSNAIAQQVSLSQGTAVVKNAGRFVCCGGTMGDISIRDARNIADQVVLFEKAHGTIGDMDVKDSLLVSCGFSAPDVDQGWLLDPVVRVFDLRMPAHQLASLRPKTHPFMLKFHPLFPSSLLIVSQTGTLQFYDVNSLLPSGDAYQVFDASELRQLSSFDISSSAETLVFGDNEGDTYTWGRKDAPIINTFSEPTEAPINTVPGMAAPVYNMDGTPQYFEEDMPFTLFAFTADEEPLSSWPANNHMIRMGKAPRRLSKKVLSQLQYREFIGHATNPGLKSLQEVYEPDPFDNVFPDPMWSEPVLGGGRRSLQSQKASYAIPKRSRPQLTAVAQPASNTVSKKYRRTELLERTVAFDDFDFSRYNNTPLRGLENMLPLSYMNPLLQALFFLPPLDRTVRTVMLAHSCKRRFCLSCELGFLFHMMGQRPVAPGVPCSPANFLRTIRQLKEAEGLGLFETEDTHAPTRLVNRQHRLIRFVLTQLHNEAPIFTEGIFPASPTSPLAASKGGAVGIANLSHLIQAKDVEHGRSQELKANQAPTVIERIFGFRTSTVLQCSCGLGSDSDPFPDFCFELAPQNEEPQGQPSLPLPPRQAAQRFVCDLEECLNFGPVSAPTNSKGGSAHDSGGGQQATGWCKNCSRFQVMEARKNVATLPYVMTLLINGSRRNPTAQGRADADGSGVYTPRYENLPSKIFVFETPDQGLCRWQVRLGPDPSVAERSRSVAIYELVVVIFHIRDPHAHKEGHLVAEIKASAPPEAEAVWHLFNDVCVSRVTPEDGASSSAATSGWKTPCVAFYAHADEEMPPSLRKRPHLPVVTSQQLGPHTDRLFSSDECRAALLAGLGLPPSSGPPPGTSWPFTPPRSPTELPARGDIVALDAEFVQLNWDRGSPRQSSMVHGLARLSVCWPNGDAFVDDYIATDEPVADYITKYSGIVPGDLDPTVSIHHVTTLKATYLKLRNLLDRGVVFVGHGLKKDFRIINIEVPKQQYIDTVDLFHKPRQRFFSLKFLCYHVLGVCVQQEAHNSIEDASAAMNLYKAYIHLQKEGTFAQKLEELYEIGQRDNWLIPGEGLPSATPAPHTKRLQFYQQVKGQKNAQ